MSKFSIFFFQFCTISCEQNLSSSLLTYIFDKNSTSKINPYPRLTLATFSLIALWDRGTYPHLRVRGVECTLQFFLKMICKRDNFFFHQFLQQNRQNFRYFWLSWGAPLPYTIWGGVFLHTFPCKTRHRKWILTLANPRFARVRIYFRCRGFIENVCKKTPTQIGPGKRSAKTKKKYRKFIVLHSDFRVF